MGAIHYATNSRLTACGLSTDFAIHTDEPQMVTRCNECLMATGELEGCAGGCGVRMSASASAPVGPLARTKRTWRYEPSWSATTPAIAVVSRVSRCGPSPRRWASGGADHGRRRMLPQLWPRAPGDTQRCRVRGPFPGGTGSLASDLQRQQRQLRRPLASRRARRSNATASP